MSDKKKGKMFSSSSSDKDYDKNLLSKKTQSNNSVSKDSEIYCLFIYNYFKITLGTTKKKLIFFAICITVLAVLLLITGFVTPEFVIPNCSKVCKKPFKIKVYSDQALESQLKKCGYKKGTYEYNYALSAIKLHNIERACHNAQPLKFNCQMMEIAQNYSEYLANVIHDLQHSSNRYLNGTYYGENLAYTSWTPKDGETPTDMWYSEIKTYNFSRLGANHFTQNIWKGTSEFGIGIKCNGGCYMTGNYIPGGNVLNYMKENIQRPR